MFTFASANLTEQEQARVRAPLDGGATVVELPRREEHGSAREAEEEFLGAETSRRDSEFVPLSSAWEAVSER